MCAYLARSGDVWGWILLGIIDLPLGYVAMYGGDLFKFVISPWGLTVFGTLLWLCVGVALSFMIEWFKRRGRPKARNTGGE